MKVLVRAGNLDLVGNKAPQHGGDRRRLAVPHVGIADQRDVGGTQFIAIGFHEGRQVLAAAFLLAFQHQRYPDRQAAGHRMAGAAGLDKGQHLSLVVRGAARHDDLAAMRIGLKHRLKWVRVPERDRINRLHVVMGIEQDMRACLLGPMRHHHRVTGGWPRSSAEADAVQLAGDPLGGALAFGGKGGIG